VRILYFSDNYAHGVMGTKRSIFEELGRLGHNALFCNRTIVSGDYKDFFTHIERFKPDQIWFAHSALTIPEKIKSAIKVPIIGFGFSDPYYFSAKRLESYSVYITNHWDTLQKFKHLLPIHYNPTACDFNFHQKMSIEKIYAATLIGTATHPRFYEKNERRILVQKLRTSLPDLKIAVFGSGWGAANLNFGHIEGESFLKVINQSCLGLDIQDDWSPLAHRMFEYSACGTPIITRNRPEVFRLFKKDAEILTYDNFEDLRDRLNFYSKNLEKLSQIGLAAKLRCEKEHDIKYRVKSILEFLSILF